MAVGCEPSRGKEGSCLLSISQSNHLGNLNKLYLMPISLQNISIYSIFWDLVPYSISPEPILTISPQTIPEVWKSLYFVSISLHNISIHSIFWYLDPYSISPDHLLTISLQIILEDWTILQLMSIWLQNIPIHSIFWGLDPYSISPDPSRLFPLKLYWNFEKVCILCLYHYRIFPLISYSEI